MGKLFSVAVLILSLGTFGCTSSQLKTASTVIDVAGSVCEVIVAATDPALVPLCTSAKDIADAVSALVKSHSGGASTGVAYSPSNDEIYAYLASHGAQPIKQ